MKAFEIYINGEKRCTAGIGDLGHLIAHVIWVKRTERVNGKTKLKSEELGIRVSGGFTVSDGGREDLEWVREALVVGDEISIKIIESDQISSPGARRRTEPDIGEEAQRRYYERHKKQFYED